MTAQPEGKVTPQTNHEAVFIAGYEKGRIDGIAQALAALHMAFDFYPFRLPDSGQQLLPGDTGLKLAKLVEDFGNRTTKTAQKNYKAWLKRKAETITDREPGA